jgi:hypothetical protein
MVIQFALFALVVMTSSLLMLILPLLRWLFDEIAVEDFEQAMQEWRASSRLPFEAEPTEGVRLSSGLVEALQVTILVLVIALALWLVLRSFRRWQSSRQPTPGAIRETVPSEGTLAEDLAGYLRDQWQRLRDADLRLFRRLRAESVREIYTSLLALMAAAGHPRQREQTPYEYQLIADDALPRCRAELKALTEAYVRVRYGESEVEAEELADLQAAWQRIQADAKERL